MKRYTSIKKLEKDLEVFKLKSEIEKEKVKLHTAALKQDISPKSMVSSAFSKVAVGTAIKKLFGRKKKKRKKKIKA